MIRRRLFSITASVSMLVALAIIWPWYRSHDVCYRITVARKELAMLHVASAEGRLEFVIFWKWPNDVSLLSETSTYMFYNDVGVAAGTSYGGAGTDDAWLVEGYSYGSAGTLGTIQTSPTIFVPFRSITFRYRGIFGLLIVLPMCWSIGWLVRSMRNDKSTSRAVCQKCSYNLTGNVSGTCPECGTPIPAAAPNQPAH